jgi:hypothetical protein
MGSCTMASMLARAFGVEDIGGPAPEIIVGRPQGGISDGRSVLWVSEEW